MKNLYQTTHYEQVQFRTERSVKGTEKSCRGDGKRAVTESPTATRTALPCLSNTNCTNPINTGFEEIPETLNAQQWRQIWGLKENIKAWETSLGLDTMAFLTLTVRENITDKKEYARRYKSLRNYLKPAGIDTILCKADEPQSRGAWHSHLITWMGGVDIRTGFDFKAFKMANQLAQVMRDQCKDRGYAPNQWLTKSDTVLRKEYLNATRRYTRSAHPQLRRAWKLIRKASKATGFGRCELVPIQHAKACGQYVGKYLEKGWTVKTQQTRGMRKLNYCRGVHRKVSPYFRAMGGASQEWRRNVKGCARHLGIQEDDFGAMEKHWGTNKWAYQHCDEINYMGRRERWLQSVEGETWDEKRKEKAYDVYDELHWEELQKIDDIRRYKNYQSNPETMKSHMDLNFLQNLYAWYFKAKEETRKTQLDGNTPVRMN